MRPHTSGSNAAASTHHLGCLGQFTDRLASWSIPREKARLRTALHQHLTEAEKELGCAGSCCGVDSLAVVTKGTRASDNSHYLFDQNR